VGVTLAAAAAAVVALVSPLSYLQGRELPGGGFAEPGRAATAGLTAWAVLGVRAGGGRPSAGSHAYLVAHEDELQSATDVELAVAAESVSGGASPALVARLRAVVRPSGQIGPALNSTFWGVIALRQAGLSVPPATARLLVAAQTRSGGWSFAPHGKPDSNDTAAALEALRALGFRGAPVRRGLAYLSGLQARDGGFRLMPGYASDAQSTAWAIQAFVASGARPPRGAYAYLARLRRADGSYRYSARYGITPVWVTSQVLPALAGKPFPLR
jgi:hypothetical protein